MDVFQILLVGFSGLLIAIGFFTLTFAWLGPRLLDSPIATRMTTGGRLSPTRSNRSLVGVWSILLGSYFLLSLTEQYSASYVAFAAWVPFGIILIQRTRKARK